VAFQQAKAMKQALCYFTASEKMPYRCTNLFNQLAMSCQRQWSDTLYGVVRLLHQ
jgi:hypothetical protein